MPQRFLRPGITTSDRWNAVSFPAQSLFVRILTLVDDFGRYDGRVPILHGQCFALRDDINPQECAALRNELHAANLISVYTVEGKDFIQVQKWQERARGERSKYPDPQFPQECAAQSSVPHAKDASLAITSSPSPSPSAGAEPPTAAGRDGKKSEGITEGKGSDRLPSTPQSKRIAMIFHRRLTTPWSKKEVAAYREIGVIPEEDLAALEAYYAANWPPCKDKNILRHDLLTLLNNFPGEVGRAQAATAKGKNSAPTLNGQKIRIVS